MQIKNNVKIHNRFDIEIIDKNTGEVKQSLVSYNIVLSQMYTRLCGGLAYFVNIHFGSGTGTLSPSRTTLFTHLGTKAAADEEIIKAIPLSVWKRKIVLNPEEYVGNTISEVGIAFGSTNTNLVTHSLLKDSEGNTISIVKTDVDVITIYATVFVTFDTSNPNLTYISMPSSNQLVNYLIGGSAAPTGAFSLNDTFLAKVKLGTTSNVTWTSDTVTKQRKTNVPRFATTVGNGHVKYLEFTNIFSLLIPSVPIFSGQAYTGVSIGAGDGARKQWEIPSANIRNASLILKINGVVVSNYTLEDFLKEYRSSNIILSVPLESWGSSVGISGDGKVLVATVMSLNKTNVYDLVGSMWVYRFTIASFNAISIALNFDGSVIALLSSNTPFLRVYDVSGTVTNIRTNPSGQFDSGGKLVMSSDGSVLITHMTTANYVKALKWNGTSWDVNTIDTSFITSLANKPTEMSINRTGTVYAFICPISPYVYIYDLVGSTWIKRANIVTIPSVAPTGVNISEDGNSLYLLVSNVVELHIWNGSTWNKLSYVIKNPEIFKAIQSVSIDRSIMVDTNLNTGAYVETRIGIPFKIITFDIPPVIGDIITADYTVDGVHKTDQYVIDASFAIQFGEI